jgi:hypothetical protein
LATSESLRGEEHESGSTDAGSDEMLAEPCGCSSFGSLKLVEIRVEMTARYEGESLGLERTLVSLKRQVGDGQLVLACDNEQ